MSDLERDALLLTLANLHDEVVARAHLVTTPGVAFEPLPPGLTDRPARILTMLQHHTATMVGWHVLGLPEAHPSAGVADPAAVGSSSVGSAADPPFAEVAREFRATADGWLRSMAGVDLNALLAQPYPGSDDAARPTARWLLLKLLVDTGEALGEINALFDLAQGGHLET